MLATMKSINAFHLLSPSVQKVFSPGHSCPESFFPESFSQDILGAMKALGLNPGEQEVVDMTNEVLLHDDDDDDNGDDDDNDDGDGDDDNGEQEVVDMRNEVSLDNTSSQRKNY